MTKSTLAALLATTVAANAVLGLAGSAAHAGGEDWENDWTALTVSSIGSWGSAMHASRTTAMMQAMAQCRERAGASTGCGSHTTTVRGAWTVAYACGAETFVVTARTFQDAHFASINQEIELRDFEGVEIGDCRRIVAIGPDGSPAPEQALSTVWPLIPESLPFAASENMH